MGRDLDPGQRSRVGHTSGGRFRTNPRAQFNRGGNCRHRATCFTQCAGQTLGVVNAASSAQATPQIVTPGGYVAIYGTSLASNGAPVATTIPLPGTLNGTQLFLGGQPIPLIYAGPGQVNALIPQNLNPNTSYQLVIQRGSTLSVPAPLTVAEYQPGIYTLDLSGAGQGIVEIAGTTLLAAPAGNGSRPVQRGSEYLAIFATGLGPVIGSNGEAPPADGAAAPLTTIYQTTAAVTATIGGVNVPVLFSGLTPSLVATVSGQRSGPGRSADRKMRCRWCSR